MPKPNLTNEPADEYLIRYGVPFVPRLIERACGTLIWDEQGRELLARFCAVRHIECRRKAHAIFHRNPRLLHADSIDRCRWSFGREAGRCK